MGGISKRKTSEGQGLLDVKGIKILANDLNNLCSKEYTRRLSGHIGIPNKEQDYNQMNNLDAGSNGGNAEAKKDLDTASNFI